jgi:adenosylmethionine-8-amino-7-oxononanoate aminotransferase
MHIDDDWKSLDQQLIWHPFTQMRHWQQQDPVIIERGEGFYLFDVDSNRYLDGHSSLWVNIHGHGHPALVEAIRRQAQQLDHSTLLGLGNVPSVALAKILVERTPDSLARVFYSDSGSTAMEIAVKMAFQYWQLRGERDRSTFISFKGAYHGDTVGSVSVGGIDVFHERFRPLLFDALACPWPRPYQDTEFGGDPEAVTQHCLGQLRQMLVEQGEKVAAVIAECHVQGADGIWVAPPGWMSGVEALCREFGVLFVVDEVATGFCRTGKLFACELEGLKPDLMAVAKGLTGGTLPLAATLASSEIHDAFLGDYAELKHLFHGHTYTGNPIGCAAALANLALIDETGLLEALPGKIAEFANLLAPLADDEHVGDVRQLGMMVGIEVVADRGTKALFPTAWQVPQRIVVEAAKLGAVIRPLGNVMVLMPPPAMPLEMLTELVDITHRAIRSVVANPAP